MSEQHKDIIQVCRTDEHLIFSSPLKEVCESHLFYDLYKRYEKDQIAQLKEQVYANGVPKNYASNKEAILAFSQEIEMWLSHEKEKREKSGSKSKAKISVTRSVFCEALLNSVSVVVAKDTKEYEKARKNIHVTNCAISEVNQSSSEVYIFDYDNQMYVSITNELIYSYLRCCHDDILSDEKNVGVIANILRGYKGDPRLTAPFGLPKHKVACANGIFDLITGKLEPITPMWFITSRLNTKYVPYKRAMKNLKEYVKYTGLDLGWATPEQLIQDLANDDFVRAQAIKQMICAAIFNLRPQEDFYYYLKGPGRKEGKSTFLSILAHIVGEASVLYANITQFADNSVINGIGQKSLIVGDDMPTSTKMDSEVENRLKQISSARPITHDRKYASAISENVHAVIIQAGNRVPFIAQDEDSMFRRMVLIECKNRHDKHKERKDANHLKEFTTSNAYCEAFLAYVLEHVSKEAMFDEMVLCDDPEDYRSIGKSVRRFFDDEIKPNYKILLNCTDIPYMALRSAFYEWAKSQDDEYVVKNERKLKTYLTDILSEYGFEYNDRKAKDKRKHYATLLRKGEFSYDIFDPAMADVVQRDIQIEKLESKNAKVDTFTKVADVKVEEETGEAKQALRLVELQSAAQKLGTCAHTLDWAEKHKDDPEIARLLEAFRKAEAAALATYRNPKDDPDDDPDDPTPDPDAPTDEPTQPNEPNAGDISADDAQDATDSANSAESSQEAPTSAHDSQEAHTDAPAKAENEPAETEDGLSDAEAEALCVLQNVKTPNLVVGYKQKDPGPFLEMCALIEQVDTLVNSDSSYEFKQRLTRDVLYRWREMLYEFSNCLNCMIEFGFTGGRRARSLARSLPYLTLDAGEQMFEFGMKRTRECARIYYDWALTWDKSAESSADSAESSAESSANSAESSTDSAESSTDSAESSADSAESSADSAESSAEGTSPPPPIARGRPPC